MYSQSHNFNDNDKITSLKEIFTEAHLEGHIRNFFMSTSNQNSLKDYYTNATGGSIAIKTKEFKGFELGVKGIFTYQTFSSALNKPDATTGRISKWEHELYDINDFDNFNDLDRLEELYLKYNFGRGYLTYGKLEIEDTPLLNESDGRMKPFVFKGLWLNYELMDGHHFNLSWLDRVSPRSTVEWYDFNEAIGLTNNGFQPNGEVAQYHENTNSRGIGIFNYSGNVKDWTFHFYNVHLDRIINTSWLQIDYLFKNWNMGVQYALQFPLDYQMKLAYNERYIQDTENGQVLSTQLQYKFTKMKLSAAFTHAFDTGRFLSPRELGRDQLFTSISRSRMDGFGNVTVLTLGGSYDFKPDRCTMELKFTRLFGATVNEFENNKYNLDAYYQVNSRFH
ncbi:OprD family outer membrane porin [Aquimarina intermedia]|uniref:Outer membrane OprD family porin n=1 Tax=Aquimarina intermedia TaxID=350814 RepID=A0A5S5C5A7_9FLAO|nr:OprD family outer membrane porin [Aquimarina intermedia]TYP74319.1 outer membrane OprD family porin [Aquimarina intermedia]